MPQKAQKMNFLVIIIFIGFGWVAKNYHWTNQKHINLVNWYVIFICLPAIILLKIPQLNIDQSVIFPVLMAWMLIPVAAVFILLLARVYAWPKEIVGCLLLIVCFGNTSFVGFPIIQAFYGEKALAYAVIYDQVGSFLSLAIVGNFFIAKYSVKETKSSVKETNHSVKPSNPSQQQITSNHSNRVFLIKVISFPPFVALMLAFAIGDFDFPQAISYLFWLISLTLVPATMFLVGSHFELRISDPLIRPLGWAIATKMLVLPSCGLIILLLFEQHGLHAQVTLMESAMPPMVTASILAIHAKLAPKLAAAAVGYGLVAAILVIPAVYLLSNLVK